jgi:kynurenine formamidase
MVYELGTVFGEEMPQGPRENLFGFRVSQHHTPLSLTTRESPPFDFSMDVIMASPHVGTHIDGLAHIQSHGRTYGGHDVRDVFGDHGWKVNGMETSKPIVGRGVLLDVAASRRVVALPDRYEITVADLKTCLEGSRIDIARGDVVLVRTGWYASNYESDSEAYFASQPGVGPDAAIWLYDRGMSVLGTDTAGTDVIPMPERTTHKELLIDRGVHVIEIMDLEAVARDRVHEFLFICLPLRIVGATGSWVRPVAIV